LKIAHQVLVQFYNVCVSLGYVSWGTFDLDLWPWERKNYWQHAEFILSYDTWSGSCGSWIWQCHL